MKSGGPWNLRGLRPQTREVAREAARRSGMSVGEWLNSVIEAADEEDDEPSRFADFDDEDDRWRHSFGYDDRQHDRHRNARRHYRERDEDEAPVRREGRPYREERRDRADRSRRERDSYHQRPAYRPPGGDRDSLIDQAVAEITARQRVLDGEAPTEPTPDESLRPAAESREGRGESQPFESASGALPDFGGLQQQLREITARIEALRPISDLEAAITALRADLTDIGHSLTQALPQRAVESLEIEIKALAQRIDHSRRSGVDSTALAGLERGLAEVREALRGLTTAESLVGVDEAVKALARKVDVIAAKEDPAALRQLETAIGALHGVVSHVASNDSLAKVAEEIRAFSGKVDALASSTASGHALSALESRVETLAAALNASAEAGHAVPRELEKLLAGLIEKLEWVQLTHTDHAALAHLEDRIAMLVKRLDASDVRLGRLDGIERGLADLLVHIEQMRGMNSSGVGGAVKSAAVDVIERDVAEIKQTERRTQDSLDAVHGTVEQVVDRLAMIESDMRLDKGAATQAVGPLTPAGQESSSEPPPAVPPESALAPKNSLVPAAVKPAQIEAAPQRPPAPRPPIDPNLPPDHPLEPGSTGGRSRPPPPSAAERIAVSEAAIGANAKPPVIPDPGGKPDFIAAARRAAQVAASADRQSSVHAATVTPSLPRKLTRRLRSLMVAAAVVVIVVGCYQVVSRFFDDGGRSAPPDSQTEKASAPPAAASATDSAATSPGPKVIQLPAPGDNPGPANADAPPSASPGPPSATPGVVARPRRQSSNDDAAPHSAPEVTGSLPGPSAPQGPAPAPPAAAAFSDKLPAAIGGPSLRAAALAGDASAAYEVAVRFAEGREVPQNSEEAARWLDRAAKKGFAPAQFRLASLYEKGLGVKKDLAAARDLYRAAADQGHGKAMHNLAVLYAEGIDGAADYRAAAQWFRKAANHGITDSQYNLGILYARGIGVEQNLAESYKWFLLAAKEGDTEAAAKKRDEVASRLDQQSLAAARLAAQSWTAEPQPPEAITVKAPGAWDAAPRPKSRPAKAPIPDAKVN
ncbi:MAG TPA: hypothetical protein VK430_06730 [Xanthobacteraceae bacterium]|nr:hypothetical protein [Xanthobacteraceae bacterium]